MILHRLLIEDFRGVVREEVEVPASGVLVIEGPNESGKTSLMDSLEMLLEHKASSGRAEIKAASPVGRDVPVVVEAEFTIDGERMRYRKEFVRGKKTTLEFPGSARSALTGDDAHEHVRELLDRRVDRSLWRALRIAQDEPISQVDAAKGMDSLRRALDAAAGGQDPTGDDSLIERVAAERNRYLTAKKGEPTGDLARSQSRVAEAVQALDTARARLAELDTAVADHAAQQSAHEARRSSLVAIEAEVARLEEAGRAAAELQTACTTAEAEVDRAVAHHDGRLRQLRDREDLRATVERTLARESDLRKAAERAAEQLEPADARAHRARADLEGAEEAVTLARSRLDTLHAARERERRRTDLKSLEVRLDKLRAVSTDLEGKEAELAETSVTDEAVDALRAADEALREATVRSTASAPRVELSGQGEVRVDGETVDVSEDWSRQIVEDTVFDVGRVHLTVVPAGDTEALRREVTAARERFGTLLEKHQVESTAEAEKRARRTEALRAEIEALRRRRVDLLGGDTPDDLDARRRALLADVGEQPTTDEADAGDPADADPESAAATAEAELARLRAEDRAASAETGVLRTELATRTVLADEAVSRLEESRAALEEARNLTPDADLATEEERAGELARAARDAAHRARTRLDAALADAPPELLVNARASLAALIGEEREAAAAVATALGRVNAIGDQGRLDDVSEAERELEAAHRENSALWRRARAARLLHETLVARRSEALQAYQAPFHSAVVTLGTLVYGRDFDVRLGEDLTILSRRLGDVTVDYDSLSGGAREQLAVIVRIACARLVGDSGVPVFLDDTMGYTDPSRRMTMGAVIAAAAGTSQVIVLTCDRARFAGIGGAYTHVMGSSGAVSE